MKLKTKRISIYLQQICLQLLGKIKITLSFLSIKSSRKTYIKYSEYKITIPIRHNNIAIPKYFLGSSFVKITGNFQFDSNFRGRPKSNPATHIYSWRPETQCSQVISNSVLKISKNYSK